MSKLDTKLSVHDIEDAIILRYTRGIRNDIVVPNVSWGMGINYEADLIVLNRQGYATEYEIKRSYSDFVADLAQEGDAAAKVRLEAESKVRAAKEEVIAKKRAELAAAEAAKKAEEAAAAAEAAAEAAAPAAEAEVAAEAASVVVRVDPEYMRGVSPCL